MERLRRFVNDAWGYSAPRIRRADPLLMGAAIAYNSLFALVPLAVAFVAVLSFFGWSERLPELTARIEEAASPDLAAFLIEILEESSSWLDSSRAPIILVSLLIALWSGSRAVYAVQKALRAVEGQVDERGYVVTRSLGIGVTVAAGLGVIVAYTALLVGTRFWEEIDDLVGWDLSRVSAWTLAVVAIIWLWLLLWAVYRWGPPVPIRRAGIVALAVAGLVVLGSALASWLIPSKPSAASVFGAIGVFLVWLYYIGIVIVGAPTVLNGLVLAVRNQLRG